MVDGLQRTDRGVYRIQFPLAMIHDAEKTLDEGDAGMINAGKYSSYLEQTGKQGFAVDQQVEDVIQPEIIWEIGDWWKAA